MQEIPDNSIDCIICDLPYGTTAINWDKLIDFELLWQQYNRICKENVNIILFASGEFTYKLYASNPKQYKYKLIWKKNVPTGMSSAKYRPMKYYEEILVFQQGKPIYNPQMKERVGEKKECYRYNHYCGKSNHIELNKVKKKYDPDYVQPSDVLEFNVVPNRKGKLHPTEKPVELLEWLIKTYSNENDIILDNCMGSGSTGVACKRLNRDFIGIEKEEKYFEIAKERIENV
jgi:site-specific DNA-methyltransferase (adenine-specific)